jgi:hypothetical protein
LNETGVAANKPGSRAWTAAEKKELLSTNPPRVSGYEAHHINSIKGHPELAGDPRNIKFVKGRAGDLAEHGGNFRNATTGKLINRVFIGLHLASIALDAVSDFQFNKHESETGLHSDPINGVRITNVDNAAQVLDPGTTASFDGEIFTLGQDRVWRNQVGDTLYYDTKDGKNHVRRNCC